MAEALLENTSHRGACEHAGAHLKRDSAAMTEGSDAVAIEHRSSARLPTRHGTFIAHGYLDRRSGHEHLALVMGPVATQPGVLVRVHSECLTGEVFDSLRCDCRPQLELALRKVAEAGCGAVVYLRGHEGRGIGLVNKIGAYALQDQGYDTVQANERLGLRADGRDYSAAAEIVRHLGIRSVRLMTNNPSKYAALAAHGLDLIDKVPLIAGANAENSRYLKTKQHRLAHTLGL